MERVTKVCLKDLAWTWQQRRWTVEWSDRLIMGLRWLEHVMRKNFVKRMYESRIEGESVRGGTTGQMD